MKVSNTYAAMAALSVGANAMHIRYEPAATQPVELPADGVSPRPTKAPEHELFRRAGTMLYAPDNTCGFISGLAGAGYTCYSTATCAFSMSGDEGHVACCDKGECNMRYKCVDYAGFYSSSACGDGCKIDIFTLKCTDTTARYCNTISFSGGVTDYWCNSARLNGVQTAYTTISGGDGRTYSTLKSSSATVVTSGTIKQPTITVHASATTTAADNDDGGSSTPIGAIVGGVVGGVGGLALIGAVAFLFFRNKNKKKDAAAAAAAAAAANNSPGYQQHPMQQQPGAGPGGYNPVPQSGNGYYDSKNPYPSPGQQYNQPISPAGYYQPGTPDPNQQLDPCIVAGQTSPAPSFHTQHTQQTVPGQPAFQPQQAVIHEAPTNAPGTTGRGETHELA